MFSSLICRLPQLTRPARGVIHVYIYLAAIFHSQRAAVQEVVEEHLEPVGRREDAELAGARLRAASLQADAALRHGRDRRGARLQERLHRRQLHQGVLSQCLALRMDVSLVKYKHVNLILVVCLT